MLRTAEEYTSKENRVIGFCGAALTFAATLSQRGGPKENDKPPA